MEYYCAPGECSSKDTVPSWECTVQAYNYRECNYPWVLATALWNSSLYLDCSQQVTKSGRNTKAHMGLLWQLTFTWGLSDGFAEPKLTEESLNNCEDRMMYFIAFSLSLAILTIAQKVPVEWSCCQGRRLTHRVINMDFSSSRLTYWVPDLLIAESRDQHWALIRALGSRLIVFYSFYHGRGSNLLSMEKTHNLDKDCF